MASILTRLWHDPVWSKVIAGAILAVGATVATYFLDWWPVIGRFISSSYVVALSSASVPVWVIVLVVLLALPTVLFLAALIWKRLFPSQSSPPSWKLYTSDIYFGLRWRWRYLDEGHIYDMHSFCPHCDFQVYARDVSSYRVISHIAFSCESCGQQLGDFQESLESLENKIKRFIQQKIRNGTWLSQQGA